MNETYGSLASISLFKRFDTRAITRQYMNQETVYIQGDKSDAMFFIRSGNVKLTAKSKSGKKAIIAILHEGDFFGEGCLSRESLRMSTATVVQTSSITRVTRASIARSLHREPAFAKNFVSHLVFRIARIEEAFVDQIFSNSEKRLARILLVMAGFGQQSKPEPVLLKISQETLAEMVGTTRSRVSHFMNHFRDLGLIDYNGSLRVHPSLLTFLTKD
ncbi:MAG TPA: Crp/Fnr family transcriptional regulator [Terracidiphilus sp.]|nr:Crp/Fnr family transcriptional regulator [Terracidiphilus sp.]